jgi:hypothetical protein
MATYTYSKEVTRQLKATRRVASSAVELAGPITEAIDQKVAPVIDPAEPGVDWSQIQRLFGRLLEHSAEKLRQVDDNHAQTEVDSHYLRQRRDELVAKLRQDLRRARFLLDQTMSKEDARRLFPQRGRIGNLDAGNLARLGSHLATLLRGNALRPKASLEDDVINAEALVQAIEAATQELEALLAELEPKLRREAFSFDKRRQERKEAVRSFRSTRELLRGFYRLAGFDYLADELRDRRRKKAEEEGDETMEGGEMPPARPIVAAAEAAEVQLS